MVGRILPSKTGENNYFNLLDAGHDVKKGWCILHKTFIIET